MQSRIVQPELLDALPCDHPDARQSRRDLRLINLFMGNHRWIARTMRSHAQPTERILELGAGTGDLTSRLWHEGWQVDGLDVCPAPANLPAGTRWLHHDLRSFPDYHGYDVVCGNLTLHQFTAAELADLGARLSGRARLLLACEPARQRHAQWVIRKFSPFFGLNYVTCHDANVSIAAGFLGDELPRLLGLDPEQWVWRCGATLRGSYRMIAWRRTGRRNPA